MKIIQGSLVLRDKLSREYSYLLDESNSSHRSIVGSFAIANNLYNTASVLEDIVLEDYLSMINTTKAIGSNGFLNNGLIIESFTSTDYVDNDFPVDSKLNIDVQNGHLILPIENTRDLKISDIIFETDSNGSAGNAIQQHKNNKPQAMVDGSTGTLFEYESYSNIFNDKELRLSLTLKLEKEDVANGLYIKTHIVEDLKYPKIDEVQISLNGQEWEDALNIIDVNKGDHYIRFIPKKIRYVRIKFSQDTFYNIKTLFGYKRRYLIGIRQITVKQTKYFPNGEYVSKNFSGKKTINRVAFNSKQIDNKDIQYFISANNGGKWIEVKSGETKALENIDLGLHGDLNIKTIRVKVRMDRNQSPGTKEKTERVPVGNSKNYILEYAPIDIRSYIGKHVSFGEEKLYHIDLSSADEIDPSIIEDFSCPAESLKNILPLPWIPYYDGIQDDLVVRYNGILLKNNDTVYSILQHTNSKHSTLALYKDNLSGGVISLNYKPYLHSHSVNDSNIINLPMPMITKNTGSVIVKAVIYEDYEDVTFPLASDNTNDIANLFDGDSSTFWRADTKTGEAASWDISLTLNVNENIKMYSITPTAIDEGDGFSIYKYTPSSWTLMGSNDGAAWKTIDARTVSVSSWRGGSVDFLLNTPCRYQYFKFIISDNSETETQSNTCAMQSIKLFTSQTQILDSKKDYTILNRNSLKLSQEKYSPDWDYEVSYLPAINIDEYIETTEGSKEVSLDSIAGIPTDNDIAFDYTHQDAGEISNIKYYTPISKEYRVELL